ncbi:unnamed protein product [Lampetra planeri]
MRLHQNGGHRRRSCDRAQDGGLTPLGERNGGRLLRDPPREALVVRTRHHIPRPSRGSRRRDQCDEAQQHRAERFNLLCHPASPRSAAPSAAAVAASGAVAP